MFDGCRILIVDDNKDSCEIMSLILKHSNKSYDITLAYTALEAIDLIDSKEFDLYILDNQLPDSSGVALCEWIRQNDPTTPIIFYSALGGEMFEKAAIAAGADEYLVKPNDLDIFAETVQRNMSQCLSEHHRA